jgi:hypothetical protein
MMNPITTYIHIITYNKNATGSRLRWQYLTEDYNMVFIPFLNTYVSGKGMSHKQGKVYPVKSNKSKTKYFAI